MSQKSANIKDLTIEDILTKDFFWISRKEMSSRVIHNDKPILTVYAFADCFSDDDFIEMKKRVDEPNDKVYLKVHFEGPVSPRIQ